MVAPLGSWTLEHLLLTGVYRLGTSGDRHRRANTIQEEHRVEAADVSSEFLFTLVAASCRDDNRAGHKISQPLTLAGKLHKQQRWQPQGESIE